MEMKNRNQRIFSEIKKKRIMRQKIINLLKQLKRKI